MGVDSGDGGEEGMQAGMELGIDGHGAPSP
jgi:hypothetical protein